MNSQAQIALAYILDGDTAHRAAYLNGAVTVADAGKLARCWNKVHSADTGVKIGVAAFRAAWVYIIIRSCVVA